MEKKYWFVPKTYGWGLASISWQGWVAVLVYIGLVFAYLYFGYNIFTAPEKINSKEIARVIFDITLSGVAFVYLMEEKTEGKVTWKWGNK